MGEFRGDFSIMSLADLFQYIVNNRKQGTLTVTDGDSRKVVYFALDRFRLLSEGQGKGPRLGDILVHRKRISAAQLQRALEVQKEQKCRVGEALVQLGFLAEREVLAVVKEQVEEEIYDLFTWKNAWFEFVEGDAPPVLEGREDPVAAVSVDVMSLLMEAARRMDEWKMIRARLPDDEAVYRVTVAGQQFVRESPDDPLTQRVAALLDGRRTVRQVVDQSGFPRFDAYRSLYALILQDLLETVTAARAAGAESAPPPPAAALPEFSTRRQTRGVLVVSASPGARSILAADLRRARYVVVEAADGPEAVVRLGNERVHAVIVDAASMSQAWSDCEAVKRATSLPIFVLGGSHRKEDILELIRRGARDYMLKPVPGKVLLERLSKLWKEGPAEAMGDVTRRLQRKGTEIRKPGDPPPRAYPGAAGGVV